MHRESRLVAYASLVFVISCNGIEPTQTTPNEVWFSEEAQVRGVAFRHISGYEPRPLLPEIVGGGVALVDVDADGDLDLYFVQSDWNLEVSKDDLQASRPGNELYFNAGDGTFTKSDLHDDSGNQGYGMGIVPGDYDNDGDLDLYVTNLGPNVLLQNDGTVGFQDVTSTSGVVDDGWSTAASFNDFDRDGDLDLFVVNYLRWTPQLELDCYACGELTYCMPTNYNTQLERPTLRQQWRWNLR